MTTDRWNCLALTTGMAACAAIALSVGLGARSAAAEPDALVARLTAALAATAIPPGRSAPENVQALAAAVRDALEATEPVELAAETDFATGWVSARGLLTQP